MTDVRRFNGRATVTAVTIADKSHSRLRTVVDELRDAVSGEVRFDAGSRATYSTDSSNYRQIPIGVVVPRTVDDVIATVDVCHHHRLPVTSRGGGTSLAGQATNDAVIIDYSKYLNRVIDVDPKTRTAVVEPGCNLDVLQSAAREHGLVYGPDPATHNRNTFGGMIGNNSCGVHSVMAEFFGPGPLTVDQVVELDILTYDGHRMTVGTATPDELDAIIADGGRRGELYRGLRDVRDRHEHAIRNGFPAIPRRVSGFNLDRLLVEHHFDVAKALVGTEGTCVVVLHATVKLIDERPERALVVLGYPDIPAAADQVPMVREHRPVGIEGFDAKLVDAVRHRGFNSEDADLLPDGGGFLMVEFGATTRTDVGAQVQRFVAAVKDTDEPPSVKVVDGPREVDQLWRLRESALGLTARPAGHNQAYAGWEDAAVPPDRLGDYLRGFGALLEEFDYSTSVYGHLGQGCIHCRIDFRLDTVTGVNRWREFLDRAADLVVTYGGSLSGEHGDGQARGALLTKMYGDELVAAFTAFKDLWDPLDKMNPGKVIRPNEPTRDLRLGPDSALRHVDTHFAFEDDDHSFANATNRCIGVGLCRDVDSGTMCPSYMATREEADSTRGRARLLFEMLRGDELDGWRDDSIAASLDLCLACKGCKSECPVDVDMATYKAEFLSHYYQRRVRPRVAYAMGLIYWWARGASKAPRFVNDLTHAPGLSTVIKKLGGIADERRIPRFAEQSFTTWFKARVAVDALSPAGRVLLWPDTFNNYLESNALKAAVEVLEHAGYAVEIPPRPLCCGRPLYDFGMLTTAERLWKQTLETLRPWIRAGVPVVGLEPSCIAAFRDELTGLLPDDADARRLSEQTFVLSELLVRQGYDPPQLEAHVVVHPHCHQNAVLDMDAEAALLDRMGIDYEMLDAGCCGMAGSFGFDAKHYEISTRIGERSLLPEVRLLDQATEISANGFSCHQQIEQSTDRTPIHLAELLQRAIHESRKTAREQADG